MFKCLPFLKACGRHVEFIDKRHCNLISVPDEVVRSSRTLEECHLDANQIKELPRNFFRLEKIRQLTLSDNELSRIPPGIGNFTLLVELDLSRNEIGELPSNIKFCDALEALDISNNPLHRLPDGFSQLRSLRDLNLNDISISELPSDFGSLNNLKKLELRDNCLKTLPQSFAQLQKLEFLDLGGNEFLALPGLVGQLSALTELCLDGNELKTLPNEIGHLTRLQQLDASENFIENLPDTLAGLVSLTDLTLSQNSLDSLPNGIGDLKRLSVVKLDQNQLVVLTSHIGRCSNLQELYLTENFLSQLPPSIGNLANLFNLNTDRNQLTALPAELGKCSRMNILSLRDNKLRRLPNEIGRLTQLHVLDVSGNRLDRLPISISRCPLTALWLSENQSQAIVKLQKDVDEETGEEFLTCYLLPQESFETESMVSQPADTKEQPEPPLMPTPSKPAAPLPHPIQPPPVAHPPHVGDGVTVRANNLPAPAPAPPPAAATAGPQLVPAPVPAARTSGVRFSNISMGGADDEAQSKQGKELPKTRHPKFDKKAVDGHIIPKDQTHSKETVFSPGRASPPPGADGAQDEQVSASFPLLDHQQPARVRKISAHSSGTSDSAESTDHGKGQPVKHKKNKPTAAPLSQMASVSPSSPSQQHSLQPRTVGAPAAPVPRDRSKSEIVPPSPAAIAGANTAPHLPAPAQTSAVKPADPHRPQPQPQVVSIAPTSVVRRSSGRERPGKHSRSDSESESASGQSDTGSSMSSHSSGDSDQSTTPPPQPQPESAPAPAPAARRIVAAAPTSPVPPDPIPVPSTPLRATLPQSPLPPQPLSPTPVEPGKKPKKVVTMAASPPEEIIQPRLAPANVESAATTPATREVGKAAAAGDTIDANDAGRKDLPEDFSYSSGGEEIDVISRHVGFSEDVEDNEEKSSQKLIRRDTPHYTKRARIQPKTADGTDNEEVVKKILEKYRNPSGSGMLVGPGSAAPPPPPTLGLSLSIPHPATAVADQSAVRPGQSGLAIAVPAITPSVQLRAPSTSAIAQPTPAEVVAATALARGSVIPAGLSATAELEELNIHIERPPGVGLGISIAGGIGSVAFRGHDQGIFISKVTETGPAGSAGLRLGDKLVRVNGIELTSVEHHYAVSVLRNVGNTIDIVVSREVISPLATASMQRLKLKEFEKNMEIKHDRIKSTIRRDENGLGFSIAGGRGSLLREIHDDRWAFLESIYISKITPGSAAAKSGLFQVGDKILKINGIDVSEARHDQAVALLTGTEKELDLEVIREQIVPKSPGETSNALPDGLWQQTACSGDQPPRQQQGRNGVSEDQVDSSNGESGAALPVEIIRIVKQGGPLGLSICGGVDHSSHPFGLDRPGVFISKIQASGAASKTNLRVGDRVLKVNGIDLTQATHEDAVLALVQPARDILLEIRHDLPPPGLKELVIRKSVAEKLGIRIQGGVGGIPANPDDQTDEGIFISHLLPTGAVGKDGRVKLGDRLLEVNGHCLLGVSHQEAVRVLREATTDTLDHMSVLICDGIPSDRLEAAFNNVSGGGIGGSPLSAAEATNGRTPRSRLESSTSVDREDEISAMDEDEEGQTTETIEPAAPFVSKQQQPQGTARQSSIPSSGGSSSRLPPPSAGAPLVSSDDPIRNSKLPSAGGVKHSPGKRGSADGGSPGTNLDKEHLSFRSKRRLFESQEPDQQQSAPLPPPRVNPASPVSPPAAGAAATNQNSDNPKVPPRSAIPVAATQRVTTGKR